MTIDQLTAVPDLSSHTAGAIVWWRLSGNLAVDDLTGLWEKHELPKHGLPKSWTITSPGLSVALHRAMQTQKGPRRLVRGLPNNAGWALVSERSVETSGKSTELTEVNLEYDTTVKVALDAVGRLKFDPLTSSFANAIHDAFERAQVEVTPTDVSSWLVKMMDRLGGVPLRDTGGIYFIPAYAMDKWRKLVAVLRECSAHVLLNVPALRSDEAVTAIKDALVQQAEAEFNAMFDELADGIGERALKNRQATLNELESKIGKYEKLLDVSLVELRAQAEKLTAAMGAAALAQVRTTEEAS